MNRQDLSALQQIAKKMNWNGKPVVEVLESTGRFCEDMGVTIPDISTMLDYHDSIEPEVLEEMEEDEDYFYELWWDAYRTLYGY